ncbi:predicted protein [Haematococcus lacustris]|uniref:Uncharacterized protein n=1 Tax=Haematococcus lacustris TaxID=44745 RepID=A0A699ZZY4_HAELA|nr:predicted protein [Haematococcus lacustris]
MVAAQVACISPLMGKQFMSTHMELRMAAEDPGADHWRAMVHAARIRPEQREEVVAAHVRYTSKMQVVLKASAGCADCAGATPSFANAGAAHLGQYPCNSNSRIQYLGRNPDIANLILTLPHLLLAPSCLLSWSLMIDRRAALGKLGEGCTPAATDSWTYTSLARAALNEHVANMEFLVFVWKGSLELVQLARAAVAAYPFFPDAMALAIELGHNQLAS